MDRSHHHVIEPKTYYTVFAALLVLLVLTVAAAQIPNPLVNIVVAITIAVVKAALIVLYFMHVRYSNSLVQLFVVAGFAWLMLLIALTLSDFSTRGWDRWESDIDRGRPPIATETMALE